MGPTVEASLLRSSEPRLKLRCGASWLVGVRGCLLQMSDEVRVRRRSAGLGTRSGAAVQFRLGVSNGLIGAGEEFRAHEGLVACAHLCAT